jgi:transposase
MEQATRLLTISKHYESVAKEIKEKAKDDSSTLEEEEEEQQSKRQAFAYTFRLMDLSSWMYIAWGSSLKSEKKDAYDKAMHMLSELDSTLDSVRLDRYYSFSS